MKTLPEVFAFGVYLAFAGLALVVAQRWIHSLSKQAAAVLIALPLVLIGPALSTGQVYGPVDLAYMGQPLYSAATDHGVDHEFSPLGGDVTFQMIPWRKAVRYEIKNGRWPLWNRFMLSGDILAGSAIPAPYHPVNLLSYVLPLAVSLAFVAAASLFSAAWCAFLYLRELRCREEAALIGAAAWTFSGFLIFWLQWPHSLTVAALPLVLLGVRRVVRAPASDSILLLSGTFVWVLLAGHPESAFHVVAVGALYGLAELVGYRRRKVLASVAAACFAGLLSLALSAVYLLPFIEAIPQSHEYQLRRDLYAGSDRSVPVEEALQRLRVNAWPFAYGLPWLEDAPAEDPFFVPLSSAYVGSCLFPFIVLGLWWHGWRGRWLLLVMALAGLSAGASAPGLSNLLSHLPLFDLSINKRLIFAAAFALSCLAALGVEAWCASSERRRGAPVACAVLLALAAWLAGQWSVMQQAGLSSDFLATQGLRTLLPLCLVVILLAIRRLPQRAVLMVLLLTLSVQRWSEIYDLHPTFPAEAFFPPIPLLEKLKEEPGVFRVVGTGTALLPNISALYELEDVRGYQGMYFGRSRWTYPLWTETQPSHHYYRVDEVSRPFLSFLNVRFSIVPKGDPVPVGWDLWKRGPAIRIYENPAMVDRVFLPQQVRLDIPPNEMMRQMLGSTDFSRVAWIETTSAEQATAPAGAPNGSMVDSMAEIPTETLSNGPGEVRFVRSANGYSIDADMEGAGWVVISETGWEGWSARRGDEELALSFANRAFLAFHLPPGEHRVDLVYRPASFLWGRAISASAAVAVMCWFLVTARLRRRIP